MALIWLCPKLYPGFMGVKWEYSKNVLMDFKKSCSLILIKIQHYF